MMLFNKKVIEDKNKYLDSILKKEEILRRVLEKFSRGKTYNYNLRKRPWNPGGGSTLFSVKVERKKYFLKVKSASILVESRLEGEASFSKVPSLRNEHTFFMETREISPNTPKYFEYFEEDGFSFLFVEHLLPFAEVCCDLDAGELIDVYDQIEGTVRKLYDVDIVHTDIHENNIMFREKTPVLIDFEEARWLHQEIPFEKSLDVIGENEFGDVGRMPEGYGFDPGLTCLVRLREVFKAMLTNRIDSLVSKCNFDSTCPYLNSLDHGKDERIYQSIELPGYSIPGQRPLHDRRVELIYRTASKLMEGGFCHLDIGSNLGRFNIEMGRMEKVKKSVGVEAYDKYVNLARVLAFFHNSSNVEFVKAECGKDSLPRVLAGQTFDIITIYSVYHHIRAKDSFIEDLKRLNPSYLMLEMPVQKECYEGKAWNEEISIISKKMQMPFWYLLSYSDDYKRPIVLISKRDVSHSLRENKGGPRSHKEWHGNSGSDNGATVSVVLPTYNQVHFLPAAVGSLLKQRFAGFELIVVNDGSTDETKEYLDGLKDPRIRVIHQENRRLPGALNRGFRESRGKYLTWVSSDNYCHPCFLEALVGALDANPDAGLAYGDFFLVDDKGNLLKKVCNPDYGYRSLLIRNDGNAAFMYRRECMDTIGLYDESLEGAEDWDYWIRIAEYFDFVHVPDTIYYYRLHGGSMQNTMRSEVNEAAHKVIEKALARKNGQLNLSELYPGISSCADREKALIVAAYDFGTNLLRARVESRCMAALFLEKAIEGKPDFIPAHINLAITQAYAGQWDKARLCIEKAGRGEGAAMSIIQRVRDACATESTEPLEGIPYISMNKDKVELFQREWERRNVYPFTAVM